MKRSSIYMTRVSKVIVIVFDVILSKFFFGYLCNFRYFQHFDFNKLDYTIPILNFSTCAHILCGHFWVAECASWRFISMIFILNLLLVIISNFIGLASCRLLFVYWIYYVHSVNVFAKLFMGTPSLLGNNIVSRNWWFFYISWSALMRTKKK